MTKPAAILFIGPAPDLFRKLFAASIRQQTIAPPVAARQGGCDMVAATWRFPALPERGGSMAKIRHIVFHTTDVERLAKFYVDVMGLKIVHRAKNGGISLTDGYMNLSIHTNKMDGKPSGFNHFGFTVEDNEEIVERCEQLGYRAPQRRPGDRHYAEYRAIDPDGNNFDISENGYEEVRPDAAKAEAS
jgi:catechol 2,3-dioxygenase-like lactoylglutathione lyase family enzyme